MRTHIFKEFLILLAVGLVILLTGYVVVRKISFPAELNYDLPVSQEEKLGDLMKGGLWEDSPTVSDPATDSALARITGRLLNALDSTAYHYRFTIIRNAEVNAFTIPGGNIFLFSGLFEVCDTPEEAAAVLAHEIGHTEKRHVVKKLIKEFSLAALAGILSGGDPGLILQLVRHVVGTSFDREHEEEADQFAMELLEKSRIDPAHLAHFFSRLNEEDLTYNSSLEFLMSHPHHDARIEHVRSYRTHPGFAPEKLRTDWKALKDLVETKPNPEE